MREHKDPRAAGQFIFDVTVRRLRAGTDVGSCASLIGKADRKFDATFEKLKKEGAPIACRSGCAFCCHLRVTVSPHEAIALFGHLTSALPGPLASEIEERLLANADQIAQMTEAQHWSRNVKCAFLVDGACSAYSARPMACALHHSLDVTACEASFNNPSDHSVSIRKLKVIEETRAATEEGTKRALKSLQLNDEPLELHTAVAALLRDPSRVARWQAGLALLEPTDRPTGES